MKIPANIRRKILACENIAIACHVHPDGDCIGSMLALGLGIRELGKRVAMVSPDGVPKRYRPLPGAGDIQKRNRGKFDLAIAVDCSNKEILGPAFRMFERALDTVEIDHHEVRRPFTPLRLVDEKASSVGEIIYNLVRALGVTVNPEIAKNILTSIIVETNSFRLPNVTSRTFEICAGLLAKHLDFTDLTEMVYWSKTRESMQLLATCLKRCRFAEKGRLAWTIIRKGDFDKTGGKKEDVDAVADELRSIEKVKIAVLFRENQKGVLRVSLRSKGLNVARVAECFGGGGHFDVAGCGVKNTKGEIERMVAMLKKVLREKGKEASC